MPVFSGKAQDYALWKKLWMEGIFPQYGEAAQLMSLQTSLPEKVWKKIGKQENVSCVWEGA